jgi:hypothetical protein
MNPRICNHPVCKRSTRKGLARSSRPLEFDFNFVFNCVVVVSNAIVLLGAAVMNCSLCSCSGWLSAFIVVNVLCPGVVVIIDTLPAELGTYLLMVICESMLWLVVAVWRLRDSFQKQSEFILALLLYSLCTSYVAWSGPALYVEVIPTAPAPQPPPCLPARFIDSPDRFAAACDEFSLPRVGGLGSAVPGGPRAGPC